MAVNFIRGEVISQVGAFPNPVFSNFVSDGDDRFLIVLTSNHPGNDYITGVTYAGVSLTHLASVNQYNSEGRFRLWYLTGPPLGTANVVIQWAAPQNVNQSAVVALYNGVDTSDPWGDFETAFGEAAIAPIASNEGDYVFIAMSRWSSGFTSADASETLLLQTPSAIRIALFEKEGTDSTTSLITDSGSGVGRFMGVLNAAAAGATIIETVVLGDSAVAVTSNVCAAVDVMNAISQQSAESILLVDQQESVDIVVSSSAILSNVAEALENVNPIESTVAQSTLLQFQIETLEPVSELEVAFGARAAIAESVSAIDSFAGVSIYLVGVQETVSAADQIVAQSTFVVSQSEVVSPTDVLIGLLSGQIVIVESVAVADSLIGLPVNVKALTEAISAADQASGQSTVLVVLSESVNLADASAVLLGGHVGIVESVALFESGAVTLASVTSISEQLLTSDVLRVIEDVDVLIVETINPLDLSTTVRTLVWLIPPSSRVARLLPINRIASVVK